MAIAERANMVATLNLEGNFQTRVAGAAKGLLALDRATSRTQQSLAKAGRNIERGFLLAGGAIVGGLTAAVKVAGDFEAQLNTINTIARASPEALGKIGESIRKVARDTGTPLADLTQGYYDLLSAGVKAADATNVLTAANRLAIGGLATTAEGVDLLTTAINTYGGDATKAAGYADIFAKAVERGKVTAAEIAQSFAQVGPIAAASGIEIQELGAAYARLTAAGVPAAEAATSVRSAIVSLTRRTTDLEKLEKQTGKSYLSIAGSKGLVAALEELRKDAAKSGTPLIDLLGRVEGLNFVLQTTGPNFAAYNADLAAMGNAAGTAAEQMAERQQGLNFQLARLKALATDAGITIGSALLPRLVPLVSKLNDFISKNQDKIAAFGTKLAKGFDEFAAAIGKIDFSGLIGGLQLTGQVAKTIVDAFLALPPDVQKLAVAALAINKVGGGIITSGIKDIGAFLLRKLSVINAGNVTVIGKTVVTPGSGVPGVTPKGGLIQTVKLLGAVTIAGASITALAELFATQQGEFKEQTNTIDENVSNQISGGASLSDLKKSLGATEAGIENLKIAANENAKKFGAILFPVALATGLAAIAGPVSDLEKERTRLMAEIARLEAGGKPNTPDTPGQHGGLSPDEREERQAARDAWIALHDKVIALGSGSPVSALGKTTSGADAIALADVMTTNVVKGFGPYFKTTEHQELLLASIEKSQAYFLAHGDTVTAAALGADIALLQQTIDAGNQKEDIAETNRRYAAAFALRAAAEQTAAINRVRDATEQQRIANVSVTVNTSISAGQVTNSIQTHNTWTGGKLLNRYDR